MYLVYQLTFENGQTYIGSTNNLERRLIEHKSACSKERYRHRPIYQCMRECPNFTHEVIFEENCTKEVAFQLEQRFIDIHQPTLNSQRAFRTDEDLKQQHKERYERNKEQILLKSKEYNQLNREKIALQKKEYQERNKEQISLKKKENYERNKEQNIVKAQEYRKQNREKIALKRKEKYEQHKEQISLKRKEIIKCECGSIVRKDTLARHKRTKKHLEFIMATKLKSI